MGKQYPGKKVCRPVKGGKQICISKKAWSVFYATGNKRYGSGFEAKPMPKKTQETLEEITKWYMSGERWNTSSSSK